jgi:hypothetical protein
MLVALRGRSQSSGDLGHSMLSCMSASTGAPLTRWSVPRHCAVRCVLFQGGLVVPQESMIHYCRFEVYRRLGWALLQ